MHNVDAAYCYRWSGVVSVLLVMTVSPAKRMNRWSIRWKCTLAPPNEYDGSICVATMMRSVATVAVAIGLVYITGHVRQGRSTLSRCGSLSKKIVVDRLTRPVIQCIGELASAKSHIAHTGVIIVSGIIASCLCIDVIRSPRFAFKLVQGLVVERRYTAHRCCCVNHSPKSQLKRKYRLPEYLQFTRL